jgi:2,5-furandicarboxylate decarboxylase 1
MRAQFSMFENVKDMKQKLLLTFAGREKEFVKRLMLTKNRLYRKLTEAWRSPKKPKIVEDGAVKEVAEKRFVKIPVLTHFERDAGPYITSAVVYAKSVDGMENVSVHRLQVLG